MADPVPCNLDDPVSLAQATHFVPFDVANVMDLVSFIVPKQTAPPTLDAKATKPNTVLFGRKANVATKREFILDPMIGSTPTHVDFMASWSGAGMSLVDKPANVAMTFAEGSAPLAAIGGQLKIEGP